MDVNKMNGTALAYIGDAVWEVYVREYVLEQNAIDINKQNQIAKKFVRAEGQAYAIKKLMPELTEFEEALVKRARNRKISSRPHNVRPVTYKLATAFEAFLGYLYLTGRKERLDEILKKSIDLIEAADIDEVRKKGIRE
ncbi:MAG: Mini-ribonuclease 3 [Anaerovoracaceae bacterium]